MPCVMVPVSVEVPTGSQGSAALQDALQLMAQAMVRLQQDMHQRMQEAFCQQEQRMQKALHQQAQDISELMDERIREVVHQQTQMAEERMRQREEALNCREQRIEEVLKEMESKSASIVSEETSRKRKRNAPSSGENGSRNIALEELEGRMVKLEESVDRALESVFPRVEVLVAHLEATSGLLVASFSDCNSASATVQTSTSACTHLSAPASCPAVTSEPSIPQSPIDLANRRTLGEDLIKAVKERKVEDVSRLLDAGADPNYIGLCKRTPLMWASFNEQESVISLLLRKGADVNVTGNHGYTALHYAAVYDNSGWCVRLLLDAGAHVDCKDDEGRTPLHKAARYEKITTVRMLLGAGASKTSLNNEIQTPFDVAASNTIRRLLDIDQDTSDTSGILPC